MRKRYIILSLTMILTICGTVYANSSENIEAFFNNICIKINGEKFEAKDVNGDMVEPFIYNGTTYLPVRAIANAFDKEVAWDAENSTVILNSKKETYLDTLNIHNRVKSGGYGYYKSYDKVPSYSTDKKYGINHSLYFFQQGVDENWHKFEVTQSVSYKLNEEYNFFATTLIGDGQGGILTIYGDNDKILYKTPIIDEDSSNLKIEIDVTNEKMLKLEFVTDNGGIILNEAKLTK